jgi:PASTA domain
MASRFTLLLPRLIALSVIWLLGAATYSLAAENGSTPAADSAKPPSEAPPVLVVPDVRAQTFVFAKGMLEDAGFAWRVEGDVKGYATNLVAVQNPAPDAKVVDNGSPTVVLRLRRNPKYSERGIPESSSPYAGHAVVLLADWRKAHAPAKKKPKKDETKKDDSGQPSDKREAPAKDKKLEPRKPAFNVDGAPREPGKEMPLPDRARLVQRRLDAAPRPTRKLVSWWLYQHSWIVTGARFGWSGGAEALRVLIRVDQRVEARWGFGARSEALARRTLAYVESRSNG